MKKINIICFIMGIICFSIAGYIIYNKFYKQEEIKFNKDEELKQVNNKLSEIGSSLGWLIITNGIDNQNEDGTKYSIDYNKNLLEEDYNKQLFTMEYILSTKNENDKFILLNGFDKSEVKDANPTDDFILTYLDYDTFNTYYKKFFNKDFDISKQYKGDTSYDTEYVYYQNRKSGSNGVYVPMITSDNIGYKDNKYVANITITYSTRAATLIGKENDKGTIVYTKDINNNIILESFMVNK